MDEQLENLLQMPLSEEQTPHFQEFERKYNELYQLFTKLCPGANPDEFNLFLSVTAFKMLESQE